MTAPVQLASEIPGKVFEPKREGSSVVKVRSLEGLHDFMAQLLFAQVKVCGVDLSELGGIRICSKSRMDVP